MNTKTTLSTLIAAAALAAGGLAMAQADPPSSTPGNNCTATGNAMKGGNMSASPSKSACGPEATANTATVMPAAAPATAAVAPAPAPAAAVATTEPAPSATTADTTSMGNTAAAPAPKRMRVAKADRN
jgi:hypothetical protein